MQLFKTQPLDLIWFAFASKYITEESFNLYVSIARYVKPSPKQHKVIFSINEQIDRRLKLDDLKIADIREHSDILVKEMNDYLRNQLNIKKELNDCEKAYEYKQPIDPYYGESYYK